MIAQDPKIKLEELSLPVTEIYPAIQGEGRYTGFPCVIVRLGGCNLRCHWCDTKHSYATDTQSSISEIIKAADIAKQNMALITGGEPLIHENTLHLLENLSNVFKYILLETNGSASVKNIPRNTHITMDIKCPTSWTSGDTNNYENIFHLKESDEIKFVVETKEDFEWVNEISTKYNLFERFEYGPIVQPVFRVMDEKKLAMHILETNKNFRMGLQMHKYIYPANSEKV